eukprot:9386606-Lingulodinium_polyedra.AAC.1
MPTVEISIERKHALLHRSIRLAPHHSGVFASIQLRKREILDAVESSQDKAKIVGQALGGTVSAKLCMDS